MFFEATGFDERLTADYTAIGPFPGVYSRKEKINTVNSRLEIV